MGSPLPKRARRAAISKCPIYLRGSGSRFPGFTSRPAPPSTSHPGSDKKRPAICESGMSGPRPAFLFAGTGDEAERRDNRGNPGHRGGKGVPPARRRKRGGGPLHRPPPGARALDGRPGDGRGLRGRVPGGLGLARRVRRDRAPLHARGLLGGSGAQALLPRGRGALRGPPCARQDRNPRAARALRGARPRAPDRGPQFRGSPRARRGRPAHGR